MMPDRTSVNNAFYWGTIDPLDVRTHSVLRSIARGLYQFGQDEGRFEVALLIARECVDADFEKRTLTVTEKGQDGLDFYEENPEFLMRLDP